MTITAKIPRTIAPRDGAGTQVILGTAKQLLGERRPVTPVTGKLDSFQQARVQVERLLVTITDAQSVRAAEVLTDFTEAEAAAEKASLPRPRATKGQTQAMALLFRACLPHALIMAVEGARKCDSFDQSWNAALVALHTAIRRWEPAKGLKLQSFVKAVLPVEFEKERQASQVLDKSDWEAASVSAVMNRILDEGYNQPWTTWYSDTQGRIVNVNPDLFGKPIQGLVFPEFTSVTYDVGRIVSGQPMTTTEVRWIKLKGKQIQKEVKVAVANPMLAWLDDKSLSVSIKLFKTKALNKLRKTARARTGLKVADVAEAGENMLVNLREYPKFSSRSMTVRIARRPLRPIRRDEITPRMIQMGMRNRRSTDQGFDERKWSEYRIADIMSRIAQVVSYDTTISDDKGDETRMSDFLAAPETELNEFDCAKERILGFMGIYDLPLTTPIISLLSRDDLTPELVHAIATVAKGNPRVNAAQLATPHAEFEPEALADASRLTERLQKSGLYELALGLPLHKFLQAHEQGRTTFCALCSTYSVRVKHALELVNAVHAVMR